MINLATLVERTTKALSPVGEQFFPKSPEFPGDTDINGNSEVIDNYIISGISRISRNFEDTYGEFVSEGPENKIFHPEERGSRVESYFQEGKREEREKLDEATTYISRNAFQEREMAGNPACPSSSWGNSLASLAPWSDPCPGFRSGTWRDTRACALQFIVERGAAAATLGWTDVDLFGVHPTVGLAGIHCVGALMLGRVVTSIDAESIVFGGPRFCRGRQDGMSIPVWAFRLGQQ